VTWTVGYNSVGRIVSFNATGNTADFSYDANGNRRSGTRVLGAQTTSRTYTVGSSSNRLTGFTQKINSASSTSVTYGYNTNGDLVNDGLRTYTYDAEGRLAAATTGATDVSPTTRYARNALGQRVFKTEPLYPPNQGDEADPSFMQSLIAFFTKLWSPSTTQAEQLGYAYVYDEQGVLIAEVGSVPGGCVASPPPLVDLDGIPINPPNLSLPRPRQISPLDFTIPGMIVDACKAISDRMFNRFPDRNLPRNPYGDPIPDPEAEGPYTQLGQRDGRKGKYDQAREFDAAGKPVRDIYFADHGRPQNHTNPHQHDYLPNGSGGTPKHGPARPLN
jgi:YD repeat-containing protein